jgi:hypothetical protein
MDLLMITRIKKIIKKRGAECRFELFDTPLTVLNANKLAPKRAVTSNLFISSSLIFFTLKL